jgi:hypothetical protein
VIGLSLLLAVVSQPGDLSRQIAAPLANEPMGGHLKLRKGHEVVGDHVIDLWAGKLDSTMTFVDDNVENDVTDLNSHMHMPSGKRSTFAAYFPMMARGKRKLINAECFPSVADNLEVTQCEFYFEKGDLPEHFTMRYVVKDAKITKIMSWADRTEGSKS